MNGDYRAVVTTDTGASSAHGPYTSLEQADRMGRSHARRARREGASAATYRLQQAAWSDVSDEITPTMQW
jgi:hypothetical protein